MPWPTEIHPLRTRYAFVEFLRRTRFSYVLVMLGVAYILMTVLFGLLYFSANAINYPEDCIPSLTKRLFHHIYLSFMTGTTVGYGDFSPVRWGKVIAMAQGVCSAFGFALVVAFLGVKMLSPHHTLHFSDKLIFDGNNFQFRILNSHRARLLSPEIRIAMVTHCSGTVIAPTVSVKKYDDLHWLDNHDFLLGFADSVDKGLCVSEEAAAAAAHKGTNKSRFKILVSVTGTYGLQNYAQVVSYDAKDIVNGTTFKAIDYGDEDKRVKRNIRFNKLGNFWTDFNTIE